MMHHDEADGRREAFRAAVGDVVRYAEHWLAVQHRIHGVPEVQVAVGLDDEIGSAVPTGWRTSRPASR